MGCCPVIEPVLIGAAAATAAVLFTSCAGSRLLSPLLGVGFGVSLLCSGDEWIGDVDFLLCESVFPLWPPRVELRGDTLPVWFTS